MNKSNPYYPAYYHYGYPYPGQPPQQAYRRQNGTTHLVAGVVAGAAIAYLLTNKKAQQSLLAGGMKMMSGVNTEVEELKEKLEDAQAELSYYRNLGKE